MSQEVSNWQALQTDDGLTYYFNQATNQTVWEKPAAMCVTNTGAPQLEGVAAAQLQQEKSSNSTSSQTFLLEKKRMEELQLYSIGGWPFTADMCMGSTTFARLDPTGVWHELPPMNHERWGCLATSVDRKIYVLGGADESDQASFERFDPQTGVWENLATLHQNMGHMAPGDALVTVNSTLYGCHYHDGNDQITRYDKATNSWQSMNTAAPKGHPNLWWTAIGAHVYAVGIDTLERYQPETKTWESCAPPLIPRKNITHVAHEGKLYIFGGAVKVFDVEQKALTLENVKTIAAVMNRPTGLSRSEAVHCYDPQLDEWTEVAPAPSVFFSTSAASAPGGIYLHGQEGDVRLYNPVEGIISVSAPLSSKFSKLLVV